MEQKFGKNSILGRAKRPSRADIEVLREFCEREGKMVEYRKGEQLVKRFSQDKKSMDLRCLIAEHLLSQARACSAAAQASPTISPRMPSPRSCVPLVASGKAERLCVTPQQLSRIRKAVTFSEK